MKRLTLNGHILDQVAANVVMAGRGFIAGIVQAIPFGDVAIESNAEGLLPIHRVKSANEFSGFVKNPKSDPAETGYGKRDVIAFRACGLEKH